MLDALVSWTLHWVNTPYSTIALFLIAFFESFCFPIPPDILLIPLCLLAPDKALFLSTITTVASVLGGSAGYLIGFVGFQPIIRRLLKPQTLTRIHNYYQRWEGWAVGIAAFTPIPYKLFTISAGIFYVNFKIFLLASILGRGGRFFLIGLLIMVFGKHIEKFIFDKFEMFTIVFVVLLIGGFLFMKVLVKKR